MALWIAGESNFHVYANAMPGERTEEEFRALFDRAGFTLTRIVPTTSPLSVVEAKPKA